MGWVLEDCKTPIREFWEYVKSYVPNEMQVLVDVHVPKALCDAVGVTD